MENLQWHKREAERQEAVNAFACTRLGISKDDLRKKCGLLLTENDVKELLDSSSDDWPGV